MFSLHSLWYDAAVFELLYFAPVREKLYNVIEEHWSSENLQVLDLACGTGAMLEHLAKNHPAAEFHGTDFSTDMLESAKKKCSSLENVSLVHGDAADLPFGKNSFDIVLCIDSFHHFSDPSAVAKEAHRVLRENGLFIVADPALNTVTETVLVGGLFRLFDMPIQYFSREELEAILAAYGFTELDYEEKRFTNIFSWRA